MRHRLDDRHDSMRAAEPTLAQKAIIRREIQLDIDAFELMGGQVQCVPMGATGDRTAQASRLSETENRERMRMSTWSHGNGTKGRNATRATA